MGDFVLTHRLGRGAQAHVWAGSHPSTGLPVAAKVLRARHLGDPVHLQGFRNEVSSTARLRHPAIVGAYAHGVVDEAAEEASAGELRAGAPYLVLERADGGTLRPLLGLLEWPRIRSILDDLLGAVAHAHAHGVVHRDIKPGNVLLDAPGGGPKLADFGLAHALETGRASALDDVFVGSPPYMAPEQLNRRWRDYGPWTDLYSLGCVAFALAGGRPPFGSGRSVEDLIAAHEHGDVPRLQPKVAVPRGFERWVRRLLEKDPTRRCPRAADAAGGLRRLEREDAGGPMGPLRHPPRRTLTVEARPPLPLAGFGMFGLRPLPLLGRARERAALWDALRDVAQTPRPRAVIIEGPAGAGTTALAGDLCRRAHEAGAATILHASHSAIPTSADGPVPMLRRHLRCGGLDRPEVEERLRRLVGDAEHPEEARRLADLIAPAPRAGGHGGPPRGDQAHAVILSHLLRLARERPVVVRIEDVPWGLDALALVRAVLTAPSARRAPILVVATAGAEATAARPTASALLDELGRFEGVQRLRAGPLSPARTRAMLHQVLGVEVGLATRIAERSQGNPMVAVELVRGGIDRGDLQRSPRGLRLPPGATAPPPERLLAAWSVELELRLEGRPAWEAEALEVAAVLGPEVEPAPWTAACRRLGLEVPWGRVGELVDARLAQAPPEGAEVGWRFAQPLVREALLHRAATHGRAPGAHRACAEALTEAPSPRRSERVGRHLLLAGAAEDAVGPLLLGARARLLAGEHHAAEVLLAERDVALTTLGVPGDHPRRVEALVERSVVAQLRGLLDEAAEAATLAAEAARRRDAADLQARALRRLGDLRLFGGAPAAALALLDEAEGREAEPEQAAPRSLALGYGLALAGRLREGRARIEEARDGLRDAQDPHGEALCEIGLLGVARRLGDLDAAEAHGLRARKHFEATGARSSLASCVFDLGEAARARGDLDAATERYRDALARYRGPAPAAAWLPELRLATALARSGRAPEARERLNALLPTLGGHARLTYLAEAHAALALCAAHQGQWEALVQHTTHATRLRTATGFVDVDIARLLEEAGERAADANRPRQARVAQEEAISQFEALGRAAATGGPRGGGAAGS